MILLAIDHNGLPFISCPGDEHAAEANIQDGLKYLNSILLGLKSKTDAQIIPKYRITCGADVWKL